MNRHAELERWPATLTPPPWNSLVLLSPSLPSLAKMGKPYKAIKPMFERSRWRIFPGDMVWINHGPFKKETGKVLQVIKDRRVPQVIVEGINLRKKKVYTGSSEDDYFVVTLEAPIHYSQVNLLQPAPLDQKVIKDNPELLEPANRYVRAKFRFLADGTRVRIGAGGNAMGVLIPIPPSAEDTGSKLGTGGPKDAVAAETVRVTRQDDDFVQWVQTQRQARQQPQQSQQSLTAAPAAATTAAVTGTRSYSSYAAGAALQGHAGCCSCGPVQPCSLHRGVAGVAAAALPVARLNLLAGRSLAMRGWLWQQVALGRGYWN